MKKNTNSYHSLYQRRLASGDRRPSTARTGKTPISKAEKKSAIRINIEYFNNDLAVIEKVVEVDGKLTEPLGDFKQRHFENGLSSNKITQLLFNQQILNEDTQTLQDCGLFDKCVVRYCSIEKNDNEKEAEIATIEEPADLSNDNIDIHGGRWKSIIELAFPRIIGLAFNIWFCWYYGLLNFDFDLNGEVTNMYEIMGPIFPKLVFILFVEGLIAVADRVF